MISGNQNFSGENQDIQDIGQWYGINVEAIKRYKKYILSFFHTDENIPEQFLGMTVNQVNEHFTALLREVENSFSLNAVAAIEAKFRIDYIVRSTKS